MSLLFRLRQVLQVRCLKYLTLHSIWYCIFHVTYMKCSPSWTKMLKFFHSTYDSLSMLLCTLRVWPNKTASLKMLPCQTILAPLYLRSCWAAKDAGIEKSNVIDKIHVQHARNWTLSVHIQIEDVSERSTDLPKETMNFCIVWPV